MRCISKCVSLINRVLMKPDNVYVRRYGREFDVIYDWRPPPDVEDVPSLQSKLEKEAPVIERVNIGLPSPADAPNRLQRIKEMRKNKTTELEKAARSRTLKVPLDEVRKCWLETDGPRAICSLAEHFGIFRDLFETGVYFYSFVSLNISYKHDGELTPVCTGNLIKPREASSTPSVTYNADSDTLWTLLLTNPDGHLSEENSECVHWLVGNIPENKVKDGEEIFKYVQPFPPHGLGYQRLVFILFKQDARIDYSWLSGREQSDEISLSSRTFRTADFYEKLEDKITPAGLAFFQCDWDTSLKQFFHQSLNMREPVFEYDWPQPLKAKQQWYPKRKPFHEYLDRYRDPKDIAADVLKKRLKNVNPFEKEEEPFPYPFALRRPLAYKEYKAEWLQLEEEKEALKLGKYRE